MDLSFFYQTFFYTLFAFVRFLFLFYCKLYSPSPIYSFIHPPAWSLLIFVFCLPNLVARAHELCFDSEIRSIFILYHINLAAFISFHLILFIGATFFVVIASAVARALRQPSSFFDITSFFIRCARFVFGLRSLIWCFAIHDGLCNFCNS